MRVDELIARLMGFDKNARVALFVNGHGVSDVENVSQVTPGENKDMRVVVIEETKHVRG